MEMEGTGTIAGKRGHLRRRRRRRACARTGCVLVLLVLGVAAGLLWTNRAEAVKLVRRIQIEQKRSAMHYEPGEIPESLLRQAEKYPELESFVLDYPLYCDNPLEIDLTGEVKKGTIPLFLQWDERWGYKTYGDDFMAITACGPTCLAMVYAGLTGNTDMDPYTMAHRAEEEGYYVCGAGSSWSMMTELSDEIGLQATELGLDSHKISSELRDGHPIICSMGSGDFTTKGHFIVLTEVTEDGFVRVNDPNSRINSEKEWELDKVMKQMRNLWSFQLKE